MNKLYNLQELVRQILEENESARNSDNILYIEVLKKYHELFGTPDVKEMSVIELFHDMHFLRLPTFESVGRTRRKLQERNEHLRPDEEAIRLKLLTEQEYIEYVRKKYGK